MPLRNTYKLVKSAILAAVFLAPTSAIADGPIDGEYRIPEAGFNAPLANFTPPAGLKIERKIEMTADGSNIGYMHSVRYREDDGDTILVRDEIDSKIGVALFVNVKVDENLWTNAEGLVRYSGEYSETWKSGLMKIDAELDGDMLQFSYHPQGQDEPTRNEFVRNKDYHWTTIFFDLRNRELVPGKRYKRKLIDIVVGESKTVEEEYLGIRQYQVGDAILDCHVIWFDYGHVNGTIWVAEDEMGPFLVYEEGFATEGTFELHLTEYKKTRRD